MGASVAGHEDWGAIQERRIEVDLTEAWGAIQNKVSRGNPRLLRGDASPWGSLRGDQEMWEAMEEHEEAWWAMHEPWGTIQDTRELDGRGKALRGDASLEGWCKKEVGARGTMQGLEGWWKALSVDANIKWELEGRCKMERRRKVNPTNQVRAWGATQTWGRREVGPMSDETFLLFLSFLCWSSQRLSELSRLFYTSFSENCFTKYNFVYFIL